MPVEDVSMSPKDVESGPPQGEPAARPRWQRLLGLRRRKSRLLPFGLTKWGMALVALLVIGGGMAGVAEYTMQPDFCRSCHIMEPYYIAWHQSTHRDVSCMDCHFEPGLQNTLKGKWKASAQAVKYLTNTYGSKPHAEIRDESCMREGCHARRLLEGKVLWTVPRQRGGKLTIRFDHAPHLEKERRGKHLRCVSCHSQLVQGQHLVVTLDTCFLCHFKGLEHGRKDETLGGCRACHDAPKEKIQLATGIFDHGEYLRRNVGCENCHGEVVKGDGAVPRQACWTCHNQPAQIARYGETAFVHDNHVNRHKVECSNCHIQIEHHLTAGAGFLASPAEMHAPTSSRRCTQCHERTHAGPAELYRGTGGVGVPDMPSPMYRTQVDCIACHKSRKLPGDAAEVAGQTFLAVQDSCNSCHGTKYQNRLAEWRKAVSDKLALAEAAYGKTRLAAETATLAGEPQLRVRRLLDDAAHNIRLVKLGYGVHNVNYATAVLNVAIDRCRLADEILPGTGAASRPAPGATAGPTTAPAARGKL